MNQERIKFANAQISLIVESMLDHKDDDGREWNKIVLVLIKRTRENKAELTLRYFVDIPVAKVLCHDLWNGRLTEPHSEFKQSGGRERAFKLSPAESGDGYRINIGSREKGNEWDSLYFDVSEFQARCLARTVLDHLHAHEVAQAIRTAVMSPVEEA